MRRRQETANRFEIQHRVINGHRRAFVMAGDGPALLLLHGIGCDHSTWEPVVERLARNFTVIVPDLLGHGASDKPRADYTLGGYANGMRDLLAVLGIKSVTVVGHSFGGGVAMQFAYQFPKTCERILLVSSGGLGREVTPLLRLFGAPFFNHVMGALTIPGVRHVNAGALRLTGRIGARLGLGATRDLEEMARVYESFADPRARAATHSVVRGVVDTRGQVVTMADRAYLTSCMPMCVVWGRDDHVIPAIHAKYAKVMAPWARVEVLDNSGHFPHKDHPEWFCDIVEEFIATTEPSHVSKKQWRTLLLAGSVEVLPDAPAARESRLRERPRRGGARLVLVDSPGSVAV